MAIAVRHPLVAIVDDRINFLKSLIEGFPSFLEKWENDADACFKRIAAECAAGDEEVYSSVYSSYLSSLNDSDAIRNVFYQSTLVMAYSLYESSMKKIFSKEIKSFKELKELYDDNGWMTNGELKRSFDFINDVRIIRNNIVHNNFGVISKKRLLKIVENSQFLDYEEDNIYIKGDNFIIESLDSINLLLHDIYNNLGYKTIKIKK